MAFEQLNIDQKQHLNLSENAWLILEQDRAAFGNDNLTGFLNHILLNYYKKADASLAHARETRLAQYLKNLDSLTIPEEYRLQAATFLANRDIEEIQARIRDYPKGHSLKIRLNNELVAYLTEEQPAKLLKSKNRENDPNLYCQEDTYYGKKHIGKYLKALLEEYARLPYLQREEVYYAEFFQIIQDCIKDGHKVKLRVSSNNMFLMRPYQIMTDAQSTYHYLVAWSDEAERAFPYRIATLQEVRRTSLGGKLTADKKKQIEQALQEKDVPYIAEKTQEIRVQLTTEGIRKYQTILHMRPHHIRIEEENLYVFNCTPRQAEYYFSKFGPDAKVLSPQYLVNNIRQFHRKALDNYKE